MIVAEYRVTKLSSKSCLQKLGKHFFLCTSGLMKFLCFVVYYTYPIIHASNPIYKLLSTCYTKIKKILKFMNSILKFN